MKTIKLFTLLLTVLFVGSTSAQCDATFTSTSPSSGTFVFTNPGIYDAYYWDFGDGNTTSGGNTVTNVYSSNGLYSVCLTVVDSVNSCTDTYCDSVYVSGLAVTCDASWTSYPDSTGSVYFVSAQTGTGYSYYWEFGDGNTSSLANPTHTYSSNGTYSVTLTIWNGSSCSDTVGNNINVTTVGSNPVVTCDASFSTMLDSASCNTIYYGAYNTNYSDYYWYFGDGTTSNNSWGTHTYTQDGTYTIELTVYDADSAGNYICGDTTYQVVVINCNGSSGSCDASAMLVDSAGYLYGIPNTYSANYDYFWDFGDGNTSTQVYPWHQYAAPGTYNVCLTVTDSAQGCTDTQCYMYTVISPTSCNADFYLFQDSTNAGVYYAWNMSTGNNLTYFWDFGDGNTSTQAYPIHTYTSVGVYQLCLTVADGSGCTSTFCDTINVVVKANGTTLGVSPAGQFAAVEDVNIVEDVNLYPNPTSGQVNLAIDLSQQGEFTISILNYVGQFIEMNTVQLNAGQNALNLDLSTQPKGVYIVNIQDEATGSSRNIKLIKE